MIRSCRIDSVSVQSDGHIQVQHTTGETPLPAAASGNGVNYASRADIIAQAEALVANMPDETMVLLALASYLKADPNLLNPAAAQGKKATLDLTGATAAVAIA